jgi:hypothetical protein
MSDRLDPEPNAANSPLLSGGELAAPTRTSAGDPAPPLASAPGGSRPSLELRRWRPGAIVGWARAAHVRGDVLWSEGARAAVCMVPMLFAVAFGESRNIGPLGQAGFFMSAVFLPRTLDERVNVTLILTTVGGGLYLLGGDVVSTPWLALLFMIFVGVMVSLMTAWEYGAMLALGFTIIFCAGINSGSAERAATNFRLYALAVLWGGAIMLLPVWRGLPAPHRSVMSQVQSAEQGVRLGVGCATALATAYALGFAKLGWAPAAVGNIVRYDIHASRVKAVARAVGTFFGAALALAIMLVIPHETVFALVAVLFTVLNSLFKATEVGGFPLASVAVLQTVAILLLLSADRPEIGPGLAVARVGTNELGVLIGLLVIFYPLPLLTKLVRRIVGSRQWDDRHRGESG